MARNCVSTQPFTEAVPVQECVSARKYGSFGVDIPALNALALRSLSSFFNERAQLLYAAHLSRGKLVRQPVSPASAIIALQGLQRLAESGASVPFDVASIRESVLRDGCLVRNIGELGLLTWLTAQCAPEKLRTVLSDFDLGQVLERYSDGWQGRTTSLAWFLAGLAHARLADPGDLPDLTDVAVETYHFLRANQGEGGIFGHLVRPRSVGEMFGKGFGTFDDQIYSIYALSKFANAFEVEEPLESALNCANMLCALQGELGEWWFLYDKRRSRVVNRYPLIGAHQDGTAPVGLLALQQATGQSFQGPIGKGLSWIAEVTEPGGGLRIANQLILWESVDAGGRFAKYCEAALSLMNVVPNVEARHRRIVYESRADHFGWILYAFGEYGLPKVGSAGSGQ